MKIKVIDLLNKIANGEEVPEKIRFEGVDLRLEKDTYYRTNTMYSLIDYIKLKRSSLNEEVERIEEEPEIEIQALEELDGIIDYEGLNVNKIVDENRDKINKLIRAIKQIDKKLKGE